MAISAEERGQRKKRLIIILVVVGVFFVGSFLWYRRTSAGLDDKTASVESALRSKWSTIDVDELRTTYGTETKAARGLLFPQPADAFLFTAHFPSPNRVEAAYLVEAEGRQRCLVVAVTGPPPNQVRVSEHEGDC